LNPFFQQLHGARKNPLGGKYLDDCSEIECHVSSKRPLEGQVMGSTFLLRQSYSSDHPVADKDVH
jgi:hypothetical protein